MILATTKIADWDRFWSTFSTKGAEKRIMQEAGIQSPPQAAELGGQLDS